MGFIKSAANWRGSIPKSTNTTVDDSEPFEWIGPGNGPSLAQGCFKPVMPTADPDSGTTKEKDEPNEP